MPGCVRWVCAMGGCLGVCDGLVPGCVQWVGAWVCAVGGYLGVCGSEFLGVWVAGQLGGCV